MNKKQLTVVSVSIVIAVVTLACGLPRDRDRNVTNEGPTTTEETGTTESVTTSPKETTGVVGDTMTIEGDMKITVTDVDLSVTSDNQFDDPDHGGFASATVEVEALRSIQVNPMNFKMIASDGTAYKAQLLMVGVDGMLDYQRIETGQKASGIVVFDIDPDKVTDGGSVEYDGEVYWEFTG